MSQVYISRLIFLINSELAYPIDPYLYLSQNQDNFSKSKTQLMIPPSTPRFGPFQVFPVPVNDSVSLRWHLEITFDIFIPLTTGMVKDLTEQPSKAYYLHVLIWQMAGEHVGLCKACTRCLLCGRPRAKPWADSGK